jgi:UTP--glucose-1-phosphate uridylyltransferase
MVDVYAETGGNVVAVETVPWENVHRYGVVAKGVQRGKAFEILGMVEKPDRAVAPSNLIISGRYILQPDIFAKISDVAPGAGGEIQLTDGMIALLAEQKFYGLEFEGTTYDCGHKLGFLLANVAYGLDRDDIAAPFRKALQSLLAGSRH